MAARRYFEFSTAADPSGPVPVDEARFVDLRNRADEFDLFLWVDGPDALAGCRDVRESGSDGPFSRATSKRCPGRQASDKDLRPAAARTVLALIRRNDWMTPTEAFRAGNPNAAPPTLANSSVSLAHGRAYLDFERDHETWESFAFQRKTHATTEGAMRFRPGRAAADRLGLEPLDLRWGVTWSEPGDEPEMRADDLTSPPALDHRGVENGLPTWDPQRVPVLVLVGGVELIVRDAILRPGREAVLLFGIHDVQRLGPAVLRTALIGAEPGPGIPGTVALESLSPGPRIQVPGAEVTRLRADHQEILHGQWLEWGCVAIRLMGGRWDDSGDTAAVEVLFTITLPDKAVMQRRVAVPFRVVRA
jgi:hypothetical protein